jgi:hypothetical protein
MMNDKFWGAPALLAAVGAACMVFGDAGADVTIQQQTVFDLSIVKAHSDSTEYTASDKQRRDSALHCEGLMSLVCGGNDAEEIIRLDRDLQWTLTPKRKEYLEHPLPTAAQREAQMLELQAEIDKMKQCPATQRQTAPAPDQSTCKMSPPKFDIQQTDTHATLIGHDARLTQMTLTQSCSNPDTGDTCDFVIGMDTWLTQEEIAGLEDRRAFQSAYLHKLGLDAGGGLEMQAQIKRILAPYAHSLEQLAAKAGDVRGYPLKTAFRISYGGAHCAAVQNQTASGSPGASGQGSSSDSGSPGIPTNVGSAAIALGSKLGGLFGKKKSDAPADSTTPAPATAPGMIQAAQFTVETKSITPGTIAPDTFEIPAGWKLVQPPAARPSKEFTCPKS